MLTSYSFSFPCLFPSVNVRQADVSAKQGSGNQRQPFSLYPYYEKGKRLKSQNQVLAKKGVNFVSFANSKNKNFFILKSQLNVNLNKSIILKHTKDNEKMSKKNDTIYQYLLWRLLYSRFLKSQNPIISENKQLLINGKSQELEFNTKKPEQKFSDPCFARFAERTGRNKVRDANFVSFASGKFLFGFKTSEVMSDHKGAKQNLIFSFFKKDYNQNFNEVRGANFVSFTKYFFPYQKSFLCYWLLPFVGFVFTLNQQINSNILNSQQKIDTNIFTIIYKNQSFFNNFKTYSHKNIISYLVPRIEIKPSIQQDLINLNMAKNFNLKLKEHDYLFTNEPSRSQINNFAILYLKSLENFIEFYLYLPNYLLNKPSEAPRWTNFITENVLNTKASGVIPKEKENGGVIPKENSFVTKFSIKNQNNTQDEISKNNFLNNEVRDANFVSFARKKIFKSFWLNLDIIPISNNKTPFFFIDQVRNPTKKNESTKFHLNFGHFICKNNVSFLNDSNLALNYINNETGKYQNYNENKKNRYLQALFFEKNQVKLMKFALLIDKTPHNGQNEVLAIKSTNNVSFASKKKFNMINFVRDANKVSIANLQNQPYFVKESKKTKLPLSSYLKLEFLFDNFIKKELLEFKPYLFETLKNPNKKFHGIFCSGSTLKKQMQYIDKNNPISLLYLENKINNKNLFSEAHVVRTSYWQNDVLAKRLSCEAKVANNVNNFMEKNLYLLKEWPKFFYNTSAAAQRATCQTVSVTRKLEKSTIVNEVDDPNFTRQMGRSANFVSFDYLNSNYKKLSKEQLYKLLFNSFDLGSDRVQNKDSYSFPCFVRQAKRSVNKINNEIILPKEINISPTPSIFLTDPLLLKQYKTSLLSKKLDLNIKQVEVKEPEFLPVSQAEQRQKFSDGKYLFGFYKNLQINPFTLYKKNKEIKLHHTSIFKKNEEKIKSQQKIKNEYINYSLFIQKLNFKLKNILLKNQLKNSSFFKKYFKIRNLKLQDTKDLFRKEKKTNLSLLRNPQQKMEKLLRTYFSIKNKSNLTIKEKKLAKLTNQIPKGLRWPAPAIEGLASLKNNSLYNFEKHQRKKAFYNQIKQEILKKNISLKTPFDFYPPQVQSKNKKLMKLTKFAPLIAKTSFWQNAWRTFSVRNKQESRTSLPLKGILLKNILNYNNSNYSNKVRDTNFMSFANKKQNKSIQSQNSLAIAFVSDQNEKLRKLSSLWQSDEKFNKIENKMYSPRFLIKNRSFILTSMSQQKQQANTLNNKQKLAVDPLFLRMPALNIEAPYWPGPALNIEALGPGYYWEKEKYNNSTILIDSEIKKTQNEINLEKQRKYIQKKRRRKKLKKETRRRKKRKRFYPRPSWLRYRSFLKFLNKRKKERKINIVLYDKEPSHIAFGNMPEFFKEANSQTASKASPGQQGASKFVRRGASLAGLGLRRASFVSFAKQNKREKLLRKYYPLSYNFYPLYTLASHAKWASLFKTTPSHLVTEVQNKDQEIFLNYASLYEKNEKYYKEIQQKSENLFSMHITNKDNFIISRSILVDFKRLLWKSYWLRSNLNPYLKRVRNFLMKIKESKQKWEFFQNLNSFLNYMGGFNITTRFSAEMKSPNKLNQWENTLYFAEYNRITYYRIQEFISQIRENFATLLTNKNKIDSPTLQPVLKNDDYLNKEGSTFNRNNPNQQVQEIVGSGFLMLKAKEPSLGNKKLKKNNTSAAAQGAASRTVSFAKKLLKVRSSHLSHSKMQDNKRHNIISRRKTTDFWVKLGKAVMADNQSNSISGGAASQAQINEQTYFKKRREWGLLPNYIYNNSKTEPTNPQIRIIWALSKITPSLNSHLSVSDGLINRDPNNKSKTNINSFLYKRRKTWSASPESSKFREQTKYNKTKKMYRDLSIKLQTLLNEQNEFLFKFDPSNFEPHLMDKTKFWQNAPYSLAKQGGEAGTSYNKTLSIFEKRFLSEAPQWTNPVTKNVLNKEAHDVRVSNNINKNLFEPHVANNSFWQNDSYSFAKQGSLNPNNLNGDPCLVSFANVNFNNQLLNKLFQKVRQKEDKSDFLNKNKRSSFMMTKKGIRLYKKMIQINKNNTHSGPSLFKTGFGYPFDGQPWPSKPYGEFAIGLKKRGPSLAGADLRSPLEIGFVKNNNNIIVGLNETSEFFTKEQSWFNNLTNKTSFVFWWTIYTNKFKNILNFLSQKEELSFPTPVSYRNENVLSKINEAPRWTNFVNVKNPNKNFTSAYFAGEATAMENLSSDFLIKEKQISFPLFNKQKEQNEYILKTAWICSLLFHFCSILSLISFSQIRDLLKFYLLGISKIYKISLGVLEYIYKSYYRFKLVSEAHKVRIANFVNQKSFNLSFANQAFPFLALLKNKNGTLVFDPKGNKVRDANFVSFAKDQNQVLAIRSANFVSFANEKKAYLILDKIIINYLNKPISINFIKNFNLALRAKQGQTNFLKNYERKNQSFLALKILTNFIDFIDDQKPENKEKNENDSFFARKTSRSKLSFYLEKTPWIAKRETKSRKKQKINVIRNLCFELMPISISEANQKQKIPASYSFAKQEREAFPFLALLKVKNNLNLLPNIKNTKILNLNNKQNIKIVKSLNFKNLPFYLKNYTILYSLFFLNFIIKNFYGFTVGTNILLKQSFDLIGRFGPKSIFNFLEKPGELIIDWIAYMFLVEWSSDMTNTIPENVDIYLGTSYYKFIRTFHSLNFLNVLQSLHIYQKSMINNVTPLFALNFKDPTDMIKDSFYWQNLGTEKLAIPNLNLSILNLASTFIQNRIYHLYEILLFQFYQPDSDLIVRQKKGIIFWDIWGDFLMQVAEDSNINISELTSLKEEQIKLLEKSLLVEMKQPVLAKNKNINILKNQKMNPNFAREAFPFLATLKNKKGPLGIFLINQNQKSSNQKENKKIALSFFAKNLTLASHAKGAEDKHLQNTRINALGPGQRETNNFVAQQFLSYQGKDTELFIDLHPPKSFTMISLLKKNESVQTSIGSLVCQIFSGIMSKQISKNILVVGKEPEQKDNFVSFTNNQITSDFSKNSYFSSDNQNEKTLLIQAIAGETELKIITDNAYRYAMVYRGVAVGIKLLRDVFDSLSLHTPCLFLIEDIHAIGERRPLLISDDEKGSSPNGKPVFGSQREEIHEKNQVLYQLSKHVISHYRKPYKGDFSLLIPTNHFCFDLFKPNLDSFNINKINPSSLSFSSPKIFVQSKSSNDSNQILNDSLSSTINSSKSNKEKNLYKSRLLIKSSQLFAPPATSPFSVLNLKEQKKFQPYKIVSEMPWGTGLRQSSEQIAQLSKASYSIRVKVAVLADMAISTLSVKLDMITDLLVIIDSVKGNRGFVVFATTHIPYILDPALRRPGRLDETITLGLFPNLLSRWNILKSSFGLFIAGKQQTGFRNGLSLDLTYSIQYSSLPYLLSSVFYSPKSSSVQLFSNKNQIFKNKNISKFFFSDAHNVRIANIVSEANKAIPFGNSSATLAPYFQRKVSRNEISDPFLFPSENALLRAKTKWVEVPEMKLNKMNYNKSIDTNYFTFWSKPQAIAKSFDLSKFNNIKEKHNQSLNNYRITTNNQNIYRNNKKRIKILSQTYFVASNLLYEANINTCFTKEREVFPFLAKLQNKKGPFVFDPKGKDQVLALKSANNVKFAKKENFLDFLQPLNIETSLLYISLYTSPQQFQNSIIKLMSGKLGEIFLFSNIRNNSYTLKNQNQIIKQNSLKNITDFTSFGLSNSWKILSSLILSFVQKRYLYNNNLIIPKFLDFNNKNSSCPKGEVPSPPSSNIFLPARRYENYRRSFAFFAGRNTSIGIMEKIQTHQQQRLIKRLYGFSVKETFKSEVLENRYTSFTNANLMIGSFSSLLQKPSNSNWFFKNRILMRHKNYLTNQWWNAQLPEHNAETTFLSDIDWRYTFVELIGDLLLDFPDADQHYNPKNRRWLLTKGDYHNWFNFEKNFYNEIYTHFIFNSFIKAYNLFENNREVLDFYAFYILQKGLYNYHTLNEFEIIKLYKRFL